MKTGNDAGKSYTTLDAYLSAFLSLRGFVPELIQEGPKVVFSFVISSELQRAIADYSSGALVSASQLALATKALKSQIFSMKTGNRNGYGQVSHHQK